MLQFFIFILGTAIGSFLSVVIYRLPRRESIVFPPSHCPHCRHKLAWYDLIPLLSYLSLSGKCRYCRQRIPMIDPLIELLTGLLFLYLSWIFPDINIINLIYFLLIGSIFIVIFFTDLQYGIIPFQAILTGVVITLLYLLSTFTAQIFFSHLLASIGAFAIFLFLFFITKGRGMGFGDVILVFLMGLFLGFPEIAFALYIAFLTGAFASLILVLAGSKHLRHDTVPFGPFLITGTFTSLFYGPKILELVHYFLPL